MHNNYKTYIWILKIQITSLKNFKLHQFLVQKENFVPVRKD